MEPEIYAGDRVIVRRILPFFSTNLHVGDIVIAEDPAAPRGCIIKRITYCPGQYVDALGRLLGQEEYFLEGENAHSIDSKNFGPVHSDSIVGKVIYYPDHKKID